MFCVHGVCWAIWFIILNKMCGCQPKKMRTNNKYWCWKYMKFSKFAFTFVRFVPWLLLHLHEHDGVFVAVVEAVLCNAPCLRASEYGKKKAHIFISFFFIYLCFSSILSYIFFASSLFINGNPELSSSPFISHLDFSHSCIFSSLMMI